MAANLCEFGFGSSIPVIPILDEDASKRFYLDCLGYEVDWEHRFAPGSDLYLQISLGPSVLHLNGHATKERPTVEVRIPVRDLEGYCAWLGTRDFEEKPEAVDPRYEGKNTDLNLLDPAGNHLVFWLREEEK